MNKERNFMGRFFLTHFAVIIPILLTSLVAVNVISYEIIRTEDKSAGYQLEKTKTEFWERYSNFSEESVLIANRAELSSNKMIDNPIEAYNGIEILKLKNYFDDSISSVFISYGTGMLYSSTGVASQEIYFSKMLGYGKESIQRGIAMLESGESGAILLYKNSSDGYMLYSFHTNQMKDATVSFLVSFEQLKKMFEFQYSSEQYYELRMPDETSLVFGCDATGNVIVIKEEEWEPLLENGHYLVQENSLENLGISIRLYYDRMSVDVSRWLYTMQIMNMALIVVGTFLSAILSWLFTKKRIREIALLEKVAKGESEQALPAKNIYSGLHDTIVSGINENRKLTKSVLEEKEKLQDKIVSMIFSGLYKDYEELHSAFQELGFSRCPQNYFVGAISAAPGLLPVQVRSILTDSIVAHMVHDNREIVVFLYEFQPDDEKWLQRKKIAMDIRAGLHQQGLSKVRIGMSQVYQNPMMIDDAYIEAVRTLNDILLGKLKDFYACWDNRDLASFGVLFDEEVLLKFQRALHEENLEEAEKCFQQLLYNSSVKECTFRNRIYLRYVILQCLVQYLEEDKTAEKTVLLKECININVEVEREFVNGVKNILHKCLIRKEDDNFTLMLDYINNNYQNCNLTYEEVAAAGGISKTYLSKMFRAKLGMSYIEYLTQVRMDNACRLLRTTDISVNEIVGMVGYTNVASFRRIFKNKYGISASDYRKNERRYQEEE